MWLYHLVRLTLWLNALVEYHLVNPFAIALVGKPSCFAMQIAYSSIALSHETRFLQMRWPDGYASVCSAYDPVYIAVFGDENDILSLDEPDASVDETDALPDGSHLITAAPALPASASATLISFTSTVAPKSGQVATKTTCEGHPASMKSMPEPTDTSLSQRVVINTAFRKGLQPSPLTHFQNVTTELPKSKDFISEFEHLIPGSENFTHFVNHFAPTVRRRRSRTISLYGYTLRLCDALLTFCGGLFGWLCSSLSQRRYGASRRKSVRRPPTPTTPVASSIDTSQWQLSRLNNHAVPKRLTTWLYDLLQEKTYQLAIFRRSNQKLKSANTRMRSYMISRDAFVVHLKRDNAAKEDQILDLRQQLNQEETKTNNLKSYYLAFVVNGATLQQECQHTKIQLYKQKICATFWRIIARKYFVDYEDLDKAYEEQGDHDGLKDKYDKLQDDFDDLESSYKRQGTRYGNLMSEVLEVQSALGMEDTKKGFGKRMIDNMNGVNQDREGLRHENATRLSEIMQLTEHSDALERNAENSKAELKRSNAQVEILREENTTLRTMLHSVDTLQQLLPSKGLSQILSTSTSTVFVSDDPAKKFASKPKYGDEKSKTAKVTSALSQFNKCIGRQRRYAHTTLTETSAQTLNIDKQTGMRKPTEQRRRRNSITFGERKTVTDQIPLNGSQLHMITKYQELQKAENEIVHSAKNRLASTNRLPHANGATGQNQDSHLLFSHDGQLKTEFQQTPQDLRHLFSSAFFDVRTHFEQTTGHKLTDVLAIDLPNLGASSHVQTDTWQKGTSHWDLSRPLWSKPEIRLTTDHILNSNTRTKNNALNPPPPRVYYTDPSIHNGPRNVELGRDVAKNMTKKTILDKDGLNKERPLKWERDWYLKYAEERDSKGEWGGPRKGNHGYEV